MGKLHARFDEGVRAKTCPLLYPVCCWKRLLDDGFYPTANRLARALKLEPGWVAEMLRLTLLAPDIVEAIAEGRQPRQLNPHTVRGRQDALPRDWDEQRRVLGFGPSIA